MSKATVAATKGQLDQIRYVITPISILAMLLHSGLRRRGQHPKQHGCVRATFQVLDNIPTQYKVGLFAKPASYEALIRFSNGPQVDDRQPGPQGMAIKLIGVPGRKILEAQADAGTHDFILIDGPVFFVRSTDSYAGLFKDLATRRQGARPEKWLATLEKTHPEDVAVADNYQNRIADSPLNRPFWSQVPYAFGHGDDTIGRYSVVPHPENMIAPIPPQFRDENCLRREMVDHLTIAARPASFDFFVQLRTDATPAIIDNPTVEWDTPVQKVAVITIPAQDFDRPEQNRFAENLSYTPWHALPEHRPVGQINEIRRSVYAATSRVRHFFNLTRAKEPTSAVTPKMPVSGRLRLAMLVTAALVVSAITIGIVKVWPNLHVSLPEYPVVEKRVWLAQNWSPAAREWYHHANQGGQFPPMINVPYEWFIALEQPTLSIGAADLLADQRYLDRFGYIPSTAESGAYDWRRCSEPETGAGYESGGTELLAWRHRLPVGFSCSDRQTDPMLNPDGRPWRNAATGRTMSAVGLTCAACHTGRFTYGTTEVLIDGGSAMTDVVNLNKAIGLSLLFTQKDQFRFNRFALRLLGADANDASRAVLSEQLDAVVARVWKFRGLDEMVEARGVIEGYGRLDALNRIGNQVFSIDLDKPENYAGSSAPVHYPRIWDTAWFNWAQYNGSIEQPMVRNAGEALGTGASIALAGAPSSTASLTAPLFTSTVQVGTLFKMEQLLAGKQPDAAKGFTGLVAPKWPADILGPLDQKLVERGAKLYDKICAHCHMAPIRSEAFWDPKHWTAPNKAGERYLKVNLIPVAEIGTDSAHAEDLAARKVNVPPELNIKSDEFGEALKQVVGNAVTRWYDSQTPPVPPEKREEMNGYRENNVRAPLAYKARPLDGVWATPPYLHNGSVPDLEALLSPVAERPKKFWLGHRAYDPVRVGYRSDALPGGFEFDTTKRGNRNTGHELDDGEIGRGRIGPKLSPDERSALIEFLKSL